jgi:DNA-directed RNA polymerase subunit E'/Rpb7
MFFHIILERNMQLHPRHFGPHLRDKLVAKLMKDVEGTCRYVLGFPLILHSPRPPLLRLAEPQSFEER